MDSLVLILIALKGNPLTADDLAVYLNRELGDKSPARDMNAFAHDLDILIRSDMVGQTGDKLEPCTKAIELLHQHLVIRFILKHMVPLT